MMEIMSAHTEQLDLYKRTKSLSREYSMRSNNEQEKEFNFMSSDSEEVDIDGKKIAQEDKPRGIFGFSDSTIKKKYRENAQLNSDDDDDDDNGQIMKVIEDDADECRPDTFYKIYEMYGGLQVLLQVFGL